MKNRPFILSLLLLIISAIITILFNDIFVFFHLKYSIFMLPFIYGVTAFYTGRIYTHNFKIKLSQKHKIKTILYFSFIQLILLLSFLIYMLDIKTIVELKLFINSIMIIILLTITSIFCMYFTLELGCKMEMKAIEKHFGSINDSTLQ